MKFLNSFPSIRDLSCRFKCSSYWKDISWLASGTIAAQAIILATMPVFSRIFSPADFAVQNLFCQIAGFFAVVATLRYEYFVQLPKDDHDARSLVHLVAFLGFLLTLVLTPVLWLFRGTIARWAGDAALSAWLIFIPITAAMMSLAIALQGWSQRQLLFRRSGESEIIGRTGYSITVIAGWFFSHGPCGLVMSYLGAALGKIVWLSKNFGRMSLVKYPDLVRTARTYMRLAGSLVLSHGLLACTVAIPTVFVAHVYGSETLGQYALSSLVVSFPSILLGGAIGNVYYQRTSERWSQGLNFVNIWRSTAKKLFLIGLPVYGIAILIIPWLFPLLFGNVWRPAGHYGAILTVSAFFSFVTSPMDKACLVVGAWRYVPLWHAARTATTGIVVGAALFFHWCMNIFLACLVFQQSVLYLVDYWAEWRFAHRIPLLKPKTIEIL